MNMGIAPPPNTLAAGTAEGTAIFRESAGPMVESVANPAGKKQTAITGLTGKMYYSSPPSLGLLCRCNINSPKVISVATTPAGERGSVELC